MVILSLATDLIEFQQMAAAAADKKMLVVEQYKIGSIC